MIKLLLEGGAAITELSQGQSPLFEVVKNGDIETIKLFLDAGASLEYKDHGDATALFYAAYLGQYDIAKLLIGRGANVNANTHDSRTPLHASVYAGHYEITEMLMNAGAEPTGTNKSDQGLYASALLFKYAAIRDTRLGNDEKAIKQFKLAEKYYNDSSNTFFDKSNELTSEIVKKQLLSIASVILASAAAGYQAKINAVPTANGKTVGYGSAPYHIANTSDLENLKLRYFEVASVCVTEVNLMQSILKCSKNETNLLSCIELNNL
ncbi:MAG: ankyrin repeat domain-containing protein [Candidatus Thiodiazotropha lotti]|nr:ankyrin repeat domain-containing protein [Candidatus Thiodiazotropha lotti]